MVEERPFGTTLLALFQAVTGVIELNLGILMLAIGNPLPTVFPSIDTYWVGLLMIVLGVISLFLGRSLWAGGASNWLLAISLTLIDVTIRIMLPVTYGTSWIAFAATLELDLVVLYYLTRPSTTPFFGGDGIRSVLSKFKIEMEPRMKEVRFTLRLVRKSSLSIVGASIIVFYLLVAALAPFLADPTNSMRQTGDPNMMWKDVELQATVSLEPQGPSPAHPFGTIQNQYDMYYGCIWGARSALRVGLYVAGGSMLIGLLIGIFASYYGGWIDEVLMRFTDIIFAFPGLILSMTLVVVLVPMGINRLDAVMFALTIVGWPGYARLIRGEILRIKNEDYIEAAKSVGCSDLRVITKHILPNSIYPILIVFTLDIGTVVLGAAALSFLGLGAPPGYADWGQIIAFSVNWIYGSPSNPFAKWHTFVIPGLFISLFVMGWNLLGDALRDILDPTMRRK
jgi:peptide/nickel transport system permease protein